MFNYEGYCTFKTNNYAGLKDPKGLFYVKELKSGKFYKTADFDASKASCVKVQRCCWDYFSVAYLVLAIVFLFYFLFQSFCFSGAIRHSLGFTDLIISLVILFLNIVIHELSHAMFLKMFGQKVNRMGFKMNFIFPTVYVDTSNAYLLPRARRFFVFSAGIATNLIFSGLFACLIPDKIYLVLPVFWVALGSLIPVGAIKTDGYNMLFNVVLKQDATKNKESMSFIVSKCTFIIVISVMLVASVVRFFGFQFWS